MTLTSIILLILIALFLLILEILFIPGMILGFISVILMLIGVIFSFKEYGTSIGIITLVATGAAPAAANAVQLKVAPVAVPHLKGIVGVGFGVVEGPHDAFTDREIERGQHANARRVRVPHRQGFEADVFGVEGLSSGVGTGPENGHETVADEVIRA